jgi:hypothetical protein
LQLPAPAIDLDLSRLSGCSVMSMSLSSSSRLNVEFMGPPGSTIPNVEPSEFPMISFFFFDVSVRSYKASVPDDQIGEFSAQETGIRELAGATDRHKRHNVRLVFANGAIEFDCADFYHRITVASEVSS